MRGPIRILITAAVALCAFAFAFTFTSTSTFALNDQLLTSATGVWN